MQLLKDPGNTRVIKSLPLPPQHPMRSWILFQKEGIQVNLLKQFLNKEGKILIQDYIKIIRQATNIFQSQPNLISIDDPITIVGDIHGQFYDLLKLLESDIGGNYETTKYVFLGDYVDRGNFSIQVLLLLLAMKISRPKQVIMLRGNHECRLMTSSYNFRQECLSKYNQQAYNLTMDMFNCLPLSCLINKKFLCMHGGISHQLTSLGDINIIDRCRQIPQNGLFCDLMWADPVDDINGYCQSQIQHNDTRGCSYYFGRQLVKRFFDKNNILTIVRAHQVQKQGFKLHKWFGAEQFPTVLTIFSAPNYCDFHNNKGSVIRLKNNIFDIQQYVHSIHPYLLPCFYDIFTWSIPFLIEKCSEILCHLINPNKKYATNEMPYEFMLQHQFLQKVIEKTKQQKKYNIEMVSLDGESPDQKILQTGKYKSSKMLSFEEKRYIDRINQLRPIK